MGFRKWRIGFALAIYSLSLNCLGLAAGEARYKCHVQVNEKYEEIHWFVRKQTTAKAIEASISNSRFFANDGVTTLTITRVYECVAEDKTFAQLRARKLEAQSVF